ncbi:hypothetical protein VTL71DRAFT_1325 [Oculimacula yallundae]|uniref:RING-CH-type domain-containing protein n=1 Tax=Oculimacula yallundae TaxID=86028 RepID=A0ABR4CCA7_9HELO
MASQPPSQSSRRRPSPSEQTPSSTSHEASAMEQSTSESQYVVLNNPQQSSNTPKTSSIPEPRESRRCWICQQDDTDDRPEDSEWRRPCPCSLTAHDSCLLDYIADQEATKSGDLAPQAALACPQCKAPFNIQRPKDPLVEAYGAIQRVADTLIVPTIASASLGVLYSGLLAYGLNATSVVFGVDEAANLLGGPIILARLTSNTFLEKMFKRMHLLHPFVPTNLWSQNRTLLLCMPLVAPSLILLRTSLADQASAIILPIYFLKHQNTHPSFNLTWPPTPGLTFATLPFIKKAYNAIYKYTFSDLEKKWDRATQRRPREGETAEQIENQAPADEGVFEFNIEWAREEVEVPDPNAAAVGGQQNGGVVNPNPNPNANHPMRHVDQWALQQNISTAHIATTVLGALAFPTISSAMGGLLKATLPTKWMDGFAGGFLRQKWGRSVVGGCLFVVLKDVVTLYCKWKRAKDFGKRRVLDYVGERRIRT